MESSAPTEERGDGPRTLEVVVRDQRQAELRFKIKGSTKLGKVMAAFCSKKGLDQSAMRFLFEGNVLNETSTPDGMDMEDGDFIDAMAMQTGGGGRWC